MRLKRTLMLGVMACFAAGACSGEGTEGTGGAGGAGGKEPVALPCHGSIVWADGPALGSARDHHVTFIADSAAGPHLYVNGGNTYNSTYADTIMAPLASDGSVGAWQPTLSMPGARAGHALVVREPHVVLMGGRRIAGGLVDLSEVLIGTLAADGQVTGWNNGPDLPATRFHAYAVRVDGHIFVTGGLDGSSQSTATVFSAELTEEGALGPWAEITSLSRPRSHHVSFVSNGWLYVAGGLDGNPAGAHTSLADVERAQLGPDGTIGGWEPVNMLAAPMATGSVALYGACVLISGGIDNGSMFSSSVRRADLLDGGLGEWSTTTPLPGPRSHVHQAPILGDKIYVVGGSVGLQDVTDAVTIGTFID